MLGCALARGNRTTVLHQQVAAIVQLATHLGPALDKPSSLGSAFHGDLGDDAAPVGGQPSISLPPIRVTASALRPLVLNRCRHVPAPLALCRITEANALPRGTRTRSRPASRARGRRAGQEPAGECRWT